MKRLNKLMACLLALVMCLSLLPMAAFAEELTPIDPVQQETIDGVEDVTGDAAGKTEAETEAEEKVEPEVKEEAEPEAEEKTESETEEKAEPEAEEKTEPEAEEKTEPEAEEKTESEAEEETKSEAEGETKSETEEKTESEAEEEVESAAEGEAEPEALSIEIPEGYEEKTFSVNIQYLNQNGNSLGQGDRIDIDQKVKYSYSYEIDGKTYTQDLSYTLTEIIPGTGIMGSSNYRELKVPVPSDGQSITVTIKMENLNTNGLDWYAANGYDTAWNTTREKEIKLTLSNQGGEMVWVYNYYKEVEPEEPEPEPVERTVDILVAFTEDMGKPSFDWDAVNEGYSLEYSYVDPKTGKTVTDTLVISKAEKTELDRYDPENLDEYGNPVKKEGEVDHAFKWPLTLPVGVKGVYISFNQSNYDIDGYEWSQVVGTTDRVNGDNIGKLFVSFDNNPVTPYIRNVYTLPQPDPGPGDPGDIIDPIDPIDPADPSDVEIEDPDVPLASAIGLNDVDHMAYIIGYDDDTVRPLANITRAEVATIFFRLMTDVYRAINWSTTNDFSDVNEGDWFNNAVSTCANAEIVTGYADGTFRPNQAITRAEFAVIVAQFLGSEYTGEGIEDFTDTVGHRAADEIRRCVEAGWVTTEEETFRPDDLITRAEVMTIINRMLHRTPDQNHMIPTMKTWVDNPKGTDYYEAVQEATNEHEYEWIDESVENWTELLNMRDWAALEAEWSAANSGE